MRRDRPLVSGADEFKSTLPRLSILLT